MSEYREIRVGGENGRILIPQARWCNTFLSKLRGFTFRRYMRPDEGLVLVESEDSRLNTAIHMFFVFVPLGVIWVNDAGVVVDKALAWPWRPLYAPQAPARYVIEGGRHLLDQVEIGDAVYFAAA
jgi:hypothetical protein